MTVTNVTPPVVSGTPTQGRTLVTTNGTWTHDLDYLTYAYQWLRCDAAGANCVNIAGATNSSYVLALADVGSRIRSEVTATEADYPVPGDPGDELTWAPPTAGSGGVAVVNFTLTNATRQSSLLGAGAGRDLVIDNTEILTGSVTQITGWRNVIWIGGEMNIASASGVVTGIAIRNITGTFHLEGVRLHGAAGPHDVFVIRSPETSAGCIVQIQNCRLEAKEHASEHADGIQFQQAKCNGLRLDKVTIVSELQGTFMRVGFTVDYAKNIHFKRLNYRGTGNNMFWQNWEQSNNTTELKKIVPVTLEDVWIDMTGSARPNVARRVVPDQTGFDGISANSRRAAYMDSDGTSDYCYFSDGTQLAPNGQMSLDCQIDGIIRDGIPPGGDHCPTSVPGIAYVSPGYL